MSLKSLASLLLFAASTAAYAAPAVHVNIKAIDGTEQTVAVNQRLPQLFVAQATFDDGTPVVGLKLQFSVNACMSGLGGPGSSPCPDPAMYGHFLGAAAAPTDALGKAVSPVFVAGNAPGSYNLFVSRADWSQLIAGQTVTDTPTAASVSKLFHVVQAPALVTDPAPALSTPALIALVAILALTVRRRRLDARE